MAQWRAQGEPGERSGLRLPGALVGQVPEVLFDQRTKLLRVFLSLGLEERGAIAAGEAGERADAGFAATRAVGPAAASPVTVAAALGPGFTLVAALPFALALTLTLTLAFALTLTLALALALPLALTLTLAGHLGTEPGLGERHGGLRLGKSLGGFLRAHLRGGVLLLGRLGTALASRALRLLQGRLGALRQLAPRARGNGPHGVGGVLQGFAGRLHGALRRRLLGRQQILSGFPHLVLLLGQIVQ